MKFLYSNILPLRTQNNQQTIKECFLDNFRLSESIDIAVGYVSEASLDELDLLVENNEINNINLILGMYYIEGMPEKSYKKAVKINNKWKSEGKGEIRIVTNFKYHGKIYCFKNNNYKSIIIGSPNLSVIKPDASTRRQYESAIFIENNNECDEIFEFINQLKQENISKNILEADILIKRSHYEYLDNVESVSKILSDQLNHCLENLSEISFNLPLKVPPYEGRFSNKREYCTKSNINVCYSRPRNADSANPKPRDWFETQITVSNDILNDENWPVDSLFYVITDDGYQFKAHTTGQRNKQLSPKGNELILGWWIKGRLINAGLISPQPNTLEDENRKGMITQEILDEYGCNSLKFIKTNLTEFDEDEMCDLNVWYLSFEPR